MRERAIGLLAVSAAFAIAMWIVMPAAAQRLAVKATFCDLAQHPDQNLGKMVEVRASIAGNDLWIDDFAQKPARPAWMGVILVLPEQLKGKATFEVVRNDPLNQLFADLHIICLQREQ